jgi:ABC-type multidrug transport system fused ATPase/permease subunit
MRPQWRRSLVLAVLLFSNIGLALANPQILRAFIDSATSGAGLDTLGRLGLLFLAVALATQAVSVAETYVAENVGLSATNALRADLTLHCLQLDRDFHASHTPGELIERVDGDVSMLAKFFARFVIYVVGNGLLMLGLMILLVQVDWRVGAAMGGSVVLALIAMESVRRLAVPRWIATRQASAELFGFLEERLQGTEDIRASGATAYVMRRFFERSRQLFRRTFVAMAVSTLSLQLGLALVTAGSALALGLGGWLFLGGELTLGGVYVIFAYTQLVYRPLQEITRQIQELQQASAGLTRIGQLFAQRSAITDGVADLPEGALELSVEHVSFGYTPEEPILRDLCLHLSAGQVLGVLGRTGIGKTTLARLLLRLYDPDAGQLRLGDTDIRQVRLEELRRRVGLVTQEIQLFHASVRDNLALFDPAIRDERMLEVLDELGLSPWLARLPDGLDTRLAPGGSGLSGGEAQLLAFARVFLRQPGLVILDEASSRLDPATERLMERAVDRLLDGRTGIVIAHRMSTVQRADMIRVLDQDEVREYGPRAALAADSASAFAGLLRAGAVEALA